MLILLSYAWLFGEQGDALSQTNNLANDWPIFRGNPQLTGVSNITLPQNLEPLWIFQASKGFESSAAVVNGVVYATSLDSNLYALDLGSGKLKWKYRATETKSSPSVSKGTVYFGDAAGAFHAVEAGTGKRQWIFQTDGEINSSANFADERVLFGSYDHHLYCLSARDGSLIWKVETEGYVHATPTIIGENVAVAGCDGYFRIIRLRDGAEIKKLEAGAYVAASAAALGHRAYVGTFGNNVLCLDLLSGKRVWEYDPPQRDFPFYSSAAVNDKIAVVGGRDKILHGLDPQTGKALWSFTTKSKIDSSPVIAGARAFFGATSGEIYALDLSNGKVVWQFETGSSIIASPAIADGKLVIGTLDGMLYCFGGK
ncbi:MAG: PQQ-binding-like beta-propeller repeat protein [candidate division KSB1 bacterium]|nr:PQQ-binding-like beta-propeller repeat protein [candidate division KSB1 bacterium]MDZ7365157.1 PQQ-binding-like beta-propeller repeat protein [candidate division KSB1 bacterium]MDZ7404367.1 PQQ-binding-like beta-propeller repeat protein [candidate division KSB1 bacterium]